MRHLDVQKLSFQSISPVLDMERMFKLVDLLTKCPPEGVAKLLCVIIEGSTLKKGSDV